MRWFCDLFDNFIAGVRFLGISSIGLTASFVTIALLGLFHVFPVQITTWSFVVWFVVLVFYSLMRNARSECNKPDLEHAFPLGRSHLIPSGLGSDVPAQGQSNSALLTLMASIETGIEARETVEKPMSTDECYDEPRASYPMEMREL